MEEKVVQRKELILHIRALLRQNMDIRKDLINFLSEKLELRNAITEYDLYNHLTLAMDEEIDDKKAHVIL